MSTGNTPRRKPCPQCEGSGVWGYWYNQCIHVCVDCDVCKGNGIVTPHTLRKYLAWRAEHAQASQGAPGGV